MCRKGSMAETRAQILVAVAISLCALLMSSIQAEAKPPAQWNPRSLSIEQMQGTQSIHVFTVDLSSDVEDVAVRITPGIVQWVDVSPAFIEGTGVAQKIDVIISINLPPDAPLGDVEGVIQLRQAIAGKPQSVVAQPLSIEIFITQLVGDDLPPDPGDAGMQSLLGIDSDDDGVRDDIQRYIFFTYPGSEPIRKVLTEVAKQYQTLLLNLDAAFENATRMARHGECLDYIEGESAAGILAALRAEALNTRDRSVAYITYNDNLGGEIILGRSLADWGSSCTFDPDASGVEQ